jgi:preprotein translocase subunit SecF
MSFKFLRGESNFPFIPRMWLFIGISTVVSIACIVCVATRGINFGIDFAGGYEIQLKFPKAVSEFEIRKLIDPLGMGDARVQRYGAEKDNEYLILMREHGTLSEANKSKLKTDFETLAGSPANLASWTVAESGERIAATFNKPVGEQQVRDVLAKYPLEIKSVARGEREDKPDFVIEFISLADRIEGALRTGMSIDPNTSIISRVEFVGPQVGSQLRQQGIMALVYALALILIYIAIRFDMFFSPGAIIATIHDLIVTIGIYSFLQIEFNLPTVAALLTLVGYSLNDTIVVYDRIRENVGKAKGRDLRVTVNAAINQTLSRTLLTSGFTLLSVTALLIFGGEAIHGFSVTLFVGIIVGTYSSIAIASPCYILLKEAYGDGKRKNSKAIAAA